MDPASGAREAEGRAEARGTIRVSRRPAMAEKIGGKRIFRQQECVLCVGERINVGESGRVKFVLYCE